MKRSSFLQPDKYDKSGEPIVEIIHRRTETDVRRQKQYTMFHAMLPEKSPVFDIFKGEITFTIKKDRPAKSFRFIMTSAPFQTGSLHAVRGCGSIGWTGYWE
jgi:hypothetical protein